MMTQETREQVAEGETGYLGISGIDITGDLILQMYMKIGVVESLMGAVSAKVQRGAK